MLKQDIRGVAPHLDVAAVADSQQAALADVQALHRRVREVGMHCLQLAGIPHLHLPVCARCDHLLALPINSHGSDRPLQHMSPVSVTSPLILSRAYI